MPCLYSVLLVEDLRDVTSWKLQARQGGAGGAQGCEKGLNTIFLDVFCLPISNHLPTELSWVISAMTRPPIQGCKWKGAWSCPGQIQVLNLLITNSKMWQPDQGVWQQPNQGRRSLEVKTSRSCSSCQDG